MRCLIILCEVIYENGSIKNSDEKLTRFNEVCNFVHDRLIPEHSTLSEATAKIMTIGTFLGIERHEPKTSMFDEIADYLRPDNEVMKNN